MGIARMQNEEKCPTTMKYMVLLGVDAEHRAPGSRGSKKIEENAIFREYQKMAQGLLVAS